jgi:hypothetical protein
MKKTNFLSISTAFYKLPEIRYPIGKKFAQYGHPGCGDFAIQFNAWLPFNSLIEIVYVPKNDNVIHRPDWLEKEGMRTKPL